MGLRDRIKKNKRFLVKCSDTVLLEEFIKSLTDVLDGYEKVYASPSCEVIASYTQNDLFSDTKKCVIAPELVKEDLDALKDMLLREDDTENAIILVEKGTIPHTKSYTSIKSVCEYFDLKPLNEKQTVSWVSQYLREISMDFDTRLPSYMVSRLGTDLGVLKNEIKKLSLLYGDKKVMVDMCQRVISESMSVKYFDFMDNFSKKRFAPVMRDLKKINEYDYVKLLHFIIGQFEKIYKVAVYKEQEMSLDDISDMMGVPRYIVRTKYFMALGYFSKIKILKVLDILNELDLKLRSTKYPKTKCFESYVIKALSA